MPNLPFYKPHQLAELQEGYYTVDLAYERLMFNYLFLRLTSNPPKNTSAMASSADSAP
jgi:hypothetical protein